MNDRGMQTCAYSVFEPKKKRLKMPFVVLEKHLCHCIGHFLRQIFQKLLPDEVGADFLWTLIC